MSDHHLGKAEDDISLSLDPDHHELPDEGDTPDEFYQSSHPESSGIFAIFVGYMCLVF